MTEAQVKTYRRDAQIYRLCWISLGAFCSARFAEQYHFKPLIIVASALMGGTLFRYLGYFVAWSTMQWLRNKVAQARKAGTLPPSNPNAPAT